MTHTLVGSIVDVTPCFGPSGRKTGGIDSVPVILGGDVTTSREEVERWNILGTVTVLEFDSLGSRCEREELMSQTDSEDGLVVDVE